MTYAALLPETLSDTLPGTFPETDFSLTTREFGDRAVLYVRGGIDLGSAPAFREALRPLVYGHHRHIAVDLAEVRFFGSDALRVLLPMEALAAARGVAFSLTSVPPQVMRILEITETAELFDARA